MRLREIIKLIRKYRYNKRKGGTSGWPKSHWCHLIYNCGEREPVMVWPNPKLVDVMFWKTDCYCSLRPADKLAYLVCKFYLKHHIWMIGDSVRFRDEAEREWLENNVSPWHYFISVLHAQRTNGENQSFALYAFRKREDALRFKLIVNHTTT